MRSVSKLPIPVYLGAQTQAATNGTEPAAAPVAEPQPDSVLLPSGRRLPLAGFGTYKVESAGAVR